MRLLASALALTLAAGAGGCVELGVVSDGTTISMGRVTRGFIVDGVRMPDSGDGFFTREKWRARGNRYGSDELVDLITGVARRMGRTIKQRIIVADLSAPGGGPAHRWHRSHQTGRDVDLLFYVRDKHGNPVEPQDMQVFDAAGRARDGSGDTFDVARNWALVREFLTAREALVQWVFVSESLGALLLEHAVAIGEPEPILAKARLALKQPGRRAPHDDHFHVRIYCPNADRLYGCVDTGPMELLALHEAGLAGEVIATMPSTPPGPPAAPAAPAAAIPARGTQELRSLGRLVRTQIHRIPLRIPLRGR